jgi:UDP-perosamine 4-acetyltransferase
MTSPSPRPDAPQPDSQAARPNVLGIGAGGHAKVVIESLRREGRYFVCGLLDASPERIGTSVLGVPVLGGDEKLETLRRSGIAQAFIGVGTARSTQPRALIWNRLQELAFEVVSVVDPSAIVSASAEIGAGTAVLPRAIINAESVIGVNVIINSGAIVEHDCRIGDHVHIATGAVLAGGVIVEDGAFVGAGSCVRPGVRIGKGAMVGAGAMVVRDVPAGMTVTGVPARPHGNEERSWMIRHAS